MVGLGWVGVLEVVGLGVAVNGFFGVIARLLSKMS